MNSKSYECCILGAGPAGFGVAMELVKHGVKNILMVDRNSVVGGLARTEEFGGAHFDVGPHRFFTKNREVNQLWHDTLGSDFRPVDRLTRIYYKNKLFNYPLKPFDTLLKLGPRESLHAFFSYLMTHFGPKKVPETFEDWIIQKFGRKLYETFFKTYTEKVWGIPCNQIGAEWAAQRIKGLDVIQILKHALLPQPKSSVKTLVERFNYPVLGAGQMYEVMSQKLVSLGMELWLGAEVQAFQCKDNKVEFIEVRRRDGRTTRVYAQQFFNSIPLTNFFKLLRPVEPVEIQRAAEALYYREHITVDLIVEGDDLFPDQWIYIHAPNVLMARVANYNNFSKEMAGGPNRTALSVEYFVFQHEPLWQKSDEEIKSLAMEELDYLGLAKKARVRQAWIVRETESYPTYYIGFQKPYEILKRRINDFANLCPIGRGGLYKYNNQDHSTLSGISAARNYLKLYDSQPHDLWGVNTDEGYHEGQLRADEDKMF